MNRSLNVIVFLICGLWGNVAVAQAGLAAAQSVVTQPKAAEAPPNPVNVKELIQTLNDPAARAKLIAQLNLLTEQQTKAKPPETEQLGSRLLAVMSEQVHEVKGEFTALGHAFIVLPAIERWLAQQVDDPARRSHWVDLAGALALILGAGAVTIWLAVLATRKPRRVIEEHRSSSGLNRLLFGVVRLLLSLVTISLYGVVSYALLSVIDLPVVVNVAAITVVNATILVMGVMALSRFLFAPTIPGLRLIRIKDYTARFLNRWVCWIGAILAFGWFGISAARVLGLPRVAAQAAFKVVGLTVVIILVSLIFQKRREVAKWIRGDYARLRDGTMTAVQPPLHEQSAFWSTRRRIAEIWHILAAAFLIVLFAIWALDVKGGLDFVLRGFAISVVVIIVTRLGVLLIDRIAEHSISLSRVVGGRFPHLQYHADRYVPILRASAALVIWLFGLLGIVEVWGLDGFGWFETPGGRATVGKTVSIVFVMVSAVIAWEFVSTIIERYLMGAVRDGSQVQRSQRVRTLLPLLRNAFLIFLIVVVILIVLSEIGLNIAPLLAGAGVVGLAIGFGAQTLVKDVITGVFILFENTIAVGDVVDLGGGHSGLVEAFSIRTIKLRDGSGGVHTVPFSNVTSVVNMTKDFAYYMFNIKVDYAQDTDRIVEIVTALGAELQNDAAFSDLILAPIEIIGVDSFTADAAILQARFKTKPIKQWTVGREFNRRLKKRFGELNIPMSFPQSMTLLDNRPPAALDARKPADGASSD